MSARPSGLVTSGVVELAAAALSGWVYTLAMTDKEKAERLGIVSAERVRQWHLDQVMLGTCTVALGLAVPDAPKIVQRSLATGAWSNAMLFLPLAFEPKLFQDKKYQAAAGVSFVSTTVGFVGIAVTAVRRRRAARH